MDLVLPRRRAGRDCAPTNDNVCRMQMRRRQATARPTVVLLKWKARARAHRKDLPVIFILVQSW